MWHWIVNIHTLFHPLLSIWECTPKLHWVLVGYKVDWERLNSKRCVQQSSYLAAVSSNKQHDFKRVHGCEEFKQLDLLTCTAAVWARWGGEALNWGKWALGGRHTAKKPDRGYQGYHYLATTHHNVIRVYYSCKPNCNHNAADLQPTRLNNYHQQTTTEWSQLSSQGTSTSSQFHTTTGCAV